jgi:3-oxoacyl-[acyl-carrier protein] reductase
VDQLFADLAVGLGEQPLDILVNNAAIGAPGTIEKTTPELFERLFAVNVRAPFFITQRALPMLSDGGRIINISSSVTRVAMPEIAYAMTKGALDVLGRTLANAVGERGITVNTVAPGVTETDMNAWLRDMPEAKAGVAGATALGRVGQPEDVAAAVAFLASEDARWVTGHLLDATGGMFLGPRI